MKNPSLARHGLIALLLCFTSSPQASDDEIDYSAPYVTLEDGELVTRYPTKPHGSSADPDASTEASGDGGAATGSTPAFLPLLLLVFLALTMAWTFLRRRRTH